MNYFDYEALPQKAEQTTAAVKQLLSNPQLGQAWFIEGRTTRLLNISWGTLSSVIVLALSTVVKFGLIDQFYLKSDWRQHGIGTELLPQLETLVIQDGVKALSLEVNIGNAGARNFYEKHGFTPRRQFCMMTKSLTESALLPLFSVVS